MHFLQNMLAQVENMNNMDGYAWWWIGLNDLEEEGQYLWPVGGPANFTWWDEEYEEPYDPYGDYDCVEMLSAEFYALKWMSIFCDDTTATMPVCQLPMKG